MSSLAILIAGLACEAILLFRATAQKTWSRYPFFYSYILVSLIGALPVSAMYLSSSRSYWEWYWIAQFATLLLGCGIVLELFDHALAPYPGATKLARFIVSIGFATIACFAVLYSALSLRWTAAGTQFQMERDLRTLQAVFLSAFVILVSYYRIELGKNVKGLLQGYGIYVAASLISFALRSFAGRSFNAWLFIPPLAFDVCLLIWVIALWSYTPAPVASSAGNLETDYESLVTATQHAVGTIRSRIVKAVRP